MSFAQTVSFFINDEKHLIDSNSSITVQCKDDIVKVYAKLLWMKTKIYELNKFENNFEIRIKPLINNFSILIAVLLFFISVVFMCSDSDFLDSIARIILITLMVIYFYSFTLGYKNYLKLEINKK